MDCYKLDQMKPSILQLIFVLAFTTGGSKSISTAKKGGGAEGSTAKEAYVTLMYGGFVLGARVLGQSLRETGTTKDLVALCTRGVSPETLKVLQADGWILRHVDNIPNPYASASKRGSYFSGAYSKIHLWNMTDYERVVYLDSDILVMSNVDHMFDCGTFCAASGHSDTFNSGSMVVEPSVAVFKDMIEQIPRIFSNDAADQGFFNEYFKNLVYARLFNWSNPSRNYQPMRMPAELNYNLRPYYMNWHGHKDISKVRIVHYKGPSKPWFWWTDFLFHLNWQWTAVRKRLPQYPNHNDSYKPAYLPIFWLPYPALFLFFCGIRSLVNSSCSQFVSNQCVSRALQLSYHYKLSRFIPLLFLTLSYFLAYSFVVPTTIIPSQGEYVFWLWSNALLVILVATYICFYYLTGMRTVCEGFPRRKLKTLVLYGLFTLSYMSAKILPPLLSPFLWRLKIFIVLLCIHLITAHVTGLLVIRLWLGRQSLAPRSNYQISA